MLALLRVGAWAQPAEAPRPLPSFSEMEAAGAVIGEIRVNNRNIFNLDDPKEDNALFRLANRLHIRTRPEVIRHTLLFSSGDPVSVQRIEESERLLRGNHYIYDVSIRPIAYHDGIVDIDVTTRDTWTLDPGASFSRQGGSNTSGLGLIEYNFLGTGTTLGLKRTSDVDRSGRELWLSNDNLFGSRAAIEYRRATFDDGARDSFKLERPFYALDTRWAAGLSTTTDHRIDSLYSGGNIIGQYRHAKETAEAYGGLSRGLVDGWTQRYSLGLLLDNDVYTPDPALGVPPQIPADDKKVAPFFRYEIIQDDFLKLRNRDRIGRAEYFALGFSAKVQLGRALAALGSTRDLWLYDAAVDDGIAYGEGHHLLLSAYARGDYGSGGGEHQFAGAGARYYRQQGGRGLFFASATADTLTHGDASEQLLLGGDNGLRGYPLRYQSGARRALVSLEQRAYTDWYPFRLFRVGGAVFYDYGRAWGGMNPNITNSGWLSDAGVGLRIMNDRSATGHIIHIDLAFPLNRDGHIQSYQFLIKSKASF